MPNVGPLASEARNDPKSQFLQREMIIKKEVSQNEKKDVKEALKEALKGALKETLKEALKEALKEDVKEDVQEDVKEYVKEDVKEDVKHAELREPPKVLAKERPEKGLDVSGFISSHGPFGPESRLTSGH